jgi:AsmA family protein
MPSDNRRQIGRLVRRMGVALAGLVILALLAGGVAALWLSRADLKPIVERVASDALGRRVTIGDLKVRWGDPLGIEVKDLAVANATWGSKPEMIRIGQASALLDVGSLYRGVLRYERLRIADAEIVLERDKTGTGNWAFGGGPGGPNLVPRTRTEFPTLIDFIGDRGLVTYRTRSGNQLGIRLDHVAISSPTDETPARLTAKGAYGDVPVRLDAETDSFAVLRNSSVPFGARFTLRGRDTDIAFNGTLWEPLDFDGVRGEASIGASALDDLLRLAGLDAKADLPLSIAGILRRDGDQWSLAAAKGTAKQSDFSGRIALSEGGPGEPDDVALDLDFTTLDVDDLAASFGGSKSAPDLAAVPLRPSRLAGINVNAALTALTAIVRGKEFRAATLKSAVAGGKVQVEELSFAFGGGTMTVSGTLADQALAVQAHLAKASVDALARMLGATDGAVQGRMNGAARVSMTGQTLGQALGSSDGAVVLALHDGAIARSLVEQLSSDLRGLFRDQEGTVPISCLLGVLTMKDGHGVISPLRLESRDAIAVGAGRIDLPNDSLDLTIKTERASTSTFALDIPIRISGSFDRLDAKPLLGGQQASLDQPAANTLPPELRALANENRCRE